MPLFVYDAEEKCFRRPVEPADAHAGTVLPPAAEKHRARRPHHHRVHWRRLFWLVFALVVLWWIRSLIEDRAGWPHPFQPQPQKPTAPPFDRDELGTARQP